MPSFDRAVDVRRADFVPDSGEAAAVLGTPKAALHASPEERERAAFEEGRAAGRAELPWAEAEALASAIDAVEQAARALASLRSSYLDLHRRALVDLALAVAERVLGREIEADGDALAGVIAQALEAAGEERPLRLRLAPGDHETLSAGHAPRLAALLEESGVAVDADPELAPGGLRLEAGRTEVDARIGEILKRVKENLHTVIEAADE